MQVGGRGALEAVVGLREFVVYGLGGFAHELDYRLVVLLVAGYQAV